MSSDYDQLLPLCYEVEGLLCLLKQRKAGLPEEVFQLIYGKLSALEEAVEKIQNQHTRDIPEAMPPIPEAAPEENTNDECDAETEESPVEEETEESEAEIAQSESIEQREEANEAEPTEAEDDAVVEEVSEKPKLKTNFFSINDRYRFRRELFNFDDEEMDETLRTLSTLTTDEAVDYLANDLCWDLDDETVADFVTIVTTHLCK